jgi:hypothetical protein
MNQPLHPTRSVLTRPSSTPLSSDRRGSCSFDLIFPIDPQDLGQPLGEAEFGGTELVQPEQVQPEQVQPEQVQHEIVDWDATEAHCAPEVQVPEVQAPDDQGTAEPLTKPTLATDFIDLLLRKPVSSAAHAPSAHPIGQSISPIVNRVNPMEAAIPQQAPVEARTETRPEADRIPSRDLLLQLPKVKTTRISSHRHSTNPALSLGILEDIGRVVTQWRDEIDGIHQQIQALYGEGPILEAWLESAQGSHSPSLDPTPEITDSPSPSLNPADRKTYWICGLDDDGQPWRETCAPKDLPQVTAAIARYQTLRQLMNQKKYHEQRLNQLAKTLTVLRGRLRA